MNARHRSIGENRCDLGETIPVSPIARYLETMRDWSIDLKSRILNDSDTTLFFLLFTSRDFSMFVRLQISARWCQAWLMSELVACTDWSFDWILWMLEVQLPLPNSKAKMKHKVCNIYFSHTCISDLGMKRFSSFKKNFYFLFMFYICFM